MPLASLPFLNFSEELPESVRRELEQYTAKLRRYLLVSLNEDGTLRTELNNSGDLPLSPGGPQTFVSVENTITPGGISDEQWWKRGPWTLDDPNAELDNVVGLRPPDPSAGTYHDYGPPGIDEAVAIELEPSGDIILTGIKRMSLQARKRMLMFRNRDSSSTITLSHDDAGSQEGNRFDLPGGVDVVLAPGQNIWLYYDIGRAAWTAAITTQAAGGLNEGGASGGGDVTGPASAVSGNFASFNGTTGKIIQDSGFAANSFATVAGSVVAVTVNLTEAQFEALNTTPFTLVPAQGASKVIMPVSVWMEVNITTAYPNNPVFSLAYASYPTLNILTTWTMTINGAAPATRLQVGQNNNPTDRLFTYATNDPRNMALVLRANGDPDPSGAATAKLHLTYVVMTTF